MAASFREDLANATCAGHLVIYYLAPYINKIRRLIYWGMSPPTENTGPIPVSKGLWKM